MQVIGIESGGWRPPMHPLRFQWSNPMYFDRVAMSSPARLEHDTLILDPEPTVRLFSFQAIVQLVPGGWVTRDPE